MSHVRIILFAISFCLSCIVMGSDCILPQHIPENERLNVTVDGVNMPVGITLLDWKSGRIGAYMAQQLIQSQLGYNVIFSDKTDSAIPAVRSLAGCPVDSKGDDMEACKTIAVRNHLVWEAWGGANIQGIDRFRTAMKDKAPEFLGFCGYDGIEGMYIFNEQQMWIFAATGLPVMFYQTWNATWHDFSPFFRPLSNIPTSDMMHCNETRASWENEMKDYVDATGDADGMWEGTFQGKCVVCNPELGGCAPAKEHGVWWLSPTCRNSPEKCIPVVTGGSGWSLDVFMQKVSIFDLPFAVGVAASWNKYVDIPRIKPILQYWWQPDNTFIDLDPKLIVFPDHDIAEWNAGRRTTASLGVKLMKYVHEGLSANADRVYDLYDKMEIQMPKLNQMLLRLKEMGASEADVVCTFLKQEVNVWSRWIPDKTNCAKRKGLSSLSGQFVSIRDSASSCDWCPPGKYSAELEDKKGLTRWCQPCPAGTSTNQPGALECEVCPKGAYAAKVGMKLCDLCAPGSYSRGVLNTSCEVCEAGTFTAEEGMSKCTLCAKGNVRGFLWDWDPRKSSGEF